MAIAGKHPKALNSFVLNFPWVHIGLGLVGNVGFVIGSVLFLLDLSAGVFFIIASVGMLIGSAGNLIVQVEDRRLRNRGLHPERMATLYRAEIADDDESKDAT